MRIAGVVTLTLLILHATAVAKPGDPPIEGCLDVEACLVKCGRGTQTACTRAGELYAELGKSKRIEATSAKIDKALGKLCDAKVGRACMVGGDLHCDASASDGNGGFGTCDATANARFQKGCEAGDGASCAFSGMLSYRGMGGEAKEAMRAHRFFEKAWTMLDDGCNAGRTDDCFALGLYRGSDKFGTADPASALEGFHRAVPLMARDCDLGDAQSCARLMLFYEKGLAVTASADRAADFKQRVCKLSPKSAACTTQAAAVEATTQVGVTGDLDKAIIRRYVKRNVGAITYCYEKSLLGDPKLQGTVNVTFTIEPTGFVSSSTAIGVNAEVAKCVAAVVKTIEFPKPMGGGKVVVNYPFTFRPASSP